MGLASRSRSPVRYGEEEAGANSEDEPLHVDISEDENCELKELCEQLQEQLSSAPMPLPGQLDIRTFFKVKPTAEEEAALSLGLTLAFDEMPSDSEAEEEALQRQGWNALEFDDMPLPSETEEEAAKSLGLSFGLDQELSVEEAYEEDALRHAFKEQFPEIEEHVEGGQHEQEAARSLGLSLCFDGASDMVEVCPSPATPPKRLLMARDSTGKPPQDAKRRRTTEALTGEIKPSEKLRHSRPDRATSEVSVH